MQGRQFEPARFVGYDMVKMARVLANFAPYLLNAYDSLFVDTAVGPGIVTAVSDEGIRIEYPLVSRKNWEWLSVDEQAKFGLKIVEQHEVAYVNSAPVGRKV